MGTGAEFTNFVFKRLLAVEDFSTRFLDFMLANFREVVLRVFATQGVFDEKITLAGTATADEVELDQSLDFRGTDQLGNIIGLAEAGSEDASAGQIKTFLVENTAAATYYVSLQYVERPVGIQINPRNGVPQYVKNVQAIGVKGDPDAVVDNGGSLTLTIDSVCESGHSHAGRTALVFMKTPVKGAITEAIAIESRTVTWNGSNNRITTAALLGQETPSVNAADYSVILLGPTVRKTDTRDTAGHLFIGTITGTGAGSTLGSGDNTDQNLIDQSLSSLTLYSGGPAWADGTTNPATTITAQLTKIITDLTSTSGGYGLAKITAAARAAWADATTNPADRADLALAKIITDLTSTIGTRGLGKLTAPARSNWEDGTTNPATTADDALNKIITDLRSTSGDKGAAKITCGLGVNWHDGSAAPSSGSIHTVLEGIIADLASEGAGSDRIDSAALSSAQAGTAIPAGSFVLPAGSVQDQLQKVLDETAAARMLGLYAARNYNVRESVIASATYAIRGIERGYDYTGGVRRYFAIGDDGAGAVTGIRYADETPAATWASGPAYAGTFTYLKGIVQYSTDLAVIGEDATGARVEYTNPDMGGAFASSPVTGASGLESKAIETFGSDFVIGCRQNVAGTGAVIQICAAGALSGGFSASGLTVPSTCRGIYCFGKSSNEIIAGGVDSSGNPMLLRATGVSTWTDVTPGGLTTNRQIKGIVYDSYNDIFWAIMNNSGSTELLYSNSDGTVWTEKTGGLGEYFSHIAVDPYTGVHVYSGGNNIYLATSLDGVYLEGFAAGEELHWENLGYVTFSAGRFLVAAQNDLLLSGTIRGGERQYPIGTN